jgi:predicted nucleic acid-binding protein
VLSLLAEAEAVEVRDIPSVSRDPGDDMFFATAKAAEADYLVSEDKDQLVVREYEGIRVVDGQTFLEILQHGEQAR